jgi:hypothetical protein
MDLLAHCAKFFGPPRKSNLRAMLPGIFMITKKREITNA